MPEDLHGEPAARHVAFEMDFTPGEGWTGTAVEPEGFSVVVTGTDADSTCELAHEKALAQFGTATVSLFRYTAMGAAQSAHEDEVSGAHLDCSLCNPEHPDHERDVRAYWSRFN